MDALGEIISITLNKGISSGFGFKFKSVNTTVCHYVTKVNEGSQAERAGLCVYDIIMKINETETDNGAIHISILEKLQIKEVKLQVLRLHEPNKFEWEK